MDFKNEFVLLSIVSIVAIVGIITMITLTTSGGLEFSSTSSGQDSAGLATGLIVTCTDTDNGLDGFVKGKMTFVFDGPIVSQNLNEVHDDVCYDYTTQTTVSSCSGSNCAVKDAFCMETSYGEPNRDYQTIGCLNGCTNGACTQSSTSSTPTTPTLPSNPTVATCKDSDDTGAGTNIYLKGVVDMTGPQMYVYKGINPTSQLAVDHSETCYDTNLNAPVASCNGDGCALKETSCFDLAEEGWGTGQTYEQDIVNCVVCNDGACIDESNLGCTDSDGGKNYGIKGHTTGIFIQNGITTTHAGGYDDSCYKEWAGADPNSKKLYEFSCNSGKVIMDEKECADSCNNGLCVEDELETVPGTLSVFPSIFVKEGGTPDALFIVGRSAAVEDVIGITNIVASLQRYAGDTLFPPNIIKFDDEVTEYQINNNNIILVGGACSNTITSQMYDNPTNCVSGYNSGLGRINIIPNAREGTYILIVHGYSAADTTLATQVLANWEQYEDLFATTSEVCVSGNVYDPIVNAC